MKVLALIPARGGSKSIPRKNIMTILDRPLLAWSIYHAEKSKYVNRIIVSTDDDEIAEMSLEWGAEVPFLRPSNISDDRSLDIDVFQHALKWLKKNEDYSPDLVVHLRPTGPARKIELIDKAIELIASRMDVDSLRSVSLAEQNPFKMWIMNEDETMRPVAVLKNTKDAHSVGRQMLPKAYWQNGYIDITRPSTVLEKSSMVGDSILPFIIRDKINDLDYPEDIPIVESALKNILDGNNEDHEIDTERHPV
jgi:N-acylneuraminate cytidylyltransferase